MQDDLSLLTSRNIRVPSGKSLSDLPGAKQDDIQRSCASNLKKGKFPGSRSHFTIGDAGKPTLNSWRKVRTTSHSHTHLSQLPIQLIWEFVYNTYLQSR